MSALDLSSFSGDKRELEIAFEAEARHLFTGKRSPRLMQRQNKAMRNAGMSWTDIDAAFRASRSLPWFYRAEEIQNLTYDAHPTWALLTKELSR